MRKLKPKNSYIYYVPRNSGDADRLNNWGWTYITAEQCRKLKALGVAVYWAPAFGDAIPGALLEAS